MNKIVLLITLLSPLTLTANNSNARAPESSAIGEPTPGMQALLDAQQRGNVERVKRQKAEKEEKEKEHRSLELFKDYSADLEETIQNTAEMVTIFSARIRERRPELPAASKNLVERALRDFSNASLEALRQSINGDKASINARIYTEELGLLNREQDLIYAQIQVMNAMGQVYEAEPEDQESAAKLWRHLRIKLLNEKEYPASTIRDRLESFAGPENGFTRLMCAAAQNDKEEVEALLAKNADICITTDLVPWMANEETINLRSCFQHLNRDNQLPEGERGYADETELPTAISMSAALKFIRTHNLFVVYPNGERLITSRFDALSLSVIAGNHEIVDLLLEDMAQKLATKKLDRSVTQEQLYEAMCKLIIFANFAESSDTKPMFNALNIAAPKKEHYSAIAKKLMRFFLEQVPTFPNGNPHSRLQHILLVAMRYGPTNITQALAEERAHQQLLHRWDFENDIFLKTRTIHLAQTSLSGEKLTILFWINAPAQSAVVGLRNLVLGQAATNPEFLRRLQEYVSEHQMLPAAMQELNTHLIPALLPIVRGYITHPEHQGVPVHIANLILGMPNNQDSVRAFMAARQRNREELEEKKEREGHNE